MIGHGSGISGHFLLADPDLGSLTTIEIEPRMIDASNIYYPANRRAFDDEIDAISDAMKNQTRLCVDQNGTLHLVWSDLREGHCQLFYSTCTP